MTGVQLQLPLEVLLHIFSYLENPPILAVDDDPPRPTNRDLQACAAVNRAFRDAAWFLFRSQLKVRHNGQPLVSPHEGLPPSAYYHLTVKKLFQQYLPNTCENLLNTSRNDVYRHLINELASNPLVFPGNNTGYNAFHRYAPTIGPGDRNAFEKPYGWSSPDNPTAYSWIGYLFESLAFRSIPLSVGEYPKYDQPPGWLGEPPIYNSFCDFIRSCRRTGLAGTFLEEDPSNPIKQILQWMETEPRPFNRYLDLFLYIPDPRPFLPESPSFEDITNCILGMFHGKTSKDIFLECLRFFEQFNFNLADLSDSDLEHLSDIFDVWNKTRKTNPEIAKQLLHMFGNHESFEENIQNIVEETLKADPNPEPPPIKMTPPFKEAENKRSACALLADAANFFQALKLSHSIKSPAYRNSARFEICRRLLDQGNLTEAIRISCFLTDDLGHLSSFHVLVCQFLLKNCDNKVPEALDHLQKTASKDRNAVQLAIHYMLHEIATTPLAATEEDVRLLWKILEQPLSLPAQYCLHRISRTRFPLNPLEDLEERDNLYVSLWILRDLMQQDRWEDAERLSKDITNEKLQKVLQYYLQKRTPF